MNIHSVRFIENFGIEYNAYAGNWHCQVSLISKERISASKEESAQVEDGAFGEDLITKGYDLKTPPAGTVLRCNDVVLKMTQVGKECHARCAIYEQVGDCIVSQEGMSTAVEHGGIISEGDELMIVEQPEQKEDNNDNNGGTQKMGSPAVPHR